MSAVKFDDQGIDPWALRRHMASVAAGLRGKSATPLTAYRRLAVYRAQRGAATFNALTPKQRRRCLKKALRQHARGALAVEFVEGVGDRTLTPEQVSLVMSMTP